MKKGVLLSVALAATLPTLAALKVGIIGCDTSHTIAFTKQMNVTKDPAVHGATVVCAYKWGSRDIVGSTNRYPKYIAEMKSMGVEMVDSIAELLKRVDAVCIETNDGRPHLAQAAEVFESGKPVFIDKPVTASYEDAVKLVKLAREKTAKWFSASSLRYVKKTQAAHRGEYGRLRGADVWSPSQFHPTQSDYFWYVIHAADPLFAMMGTGCVEVSCTSSETEDVIVGKWSDGRIGVARGLNYCLNGSAYGGVIFPEWKGQKNLGPVDIGTYEGYEPLLVEIVKFFETGVVPVSDTEILEVYAFLDAARLSKAQGGKPVKLEVPEL